jgi:hypothetical protein
VWCEPLYRRPKLDLSPVYGTVAGVIVLLAICRVAFPVYVSWTIQIHDTFGISYSYFFPLLAIVIHLVFPLLWTLLVIPVQRLFSVFVYLRWLKSFDETCQRNRRRGITFRIRRYFGQLRRQWQWQPLPTVLQAVVRLQLSQRETRGEMSNDDFPSEIHLA